MQEGFIIRIKTLLLTEKAIKTSIILRLDPKDHIIFCLLRYPSLYRQLIIDIGYRSFHQFLKQQPCICQTFSKKAKAIMAAPDCFFLQNLLCVLFGGIMVYRPNRGFVFYKLHHDLPSCADASATRSVNVTVPE